MKAKHPASIFLALTLAGTAPGLPAYGAAAPTLRSFLGGQPQGAAAMGWPEVARTVAFGLQNTPMSPGLQRVLGHLAVQLRADPQHAYAALAFTDHLASEVAARPLQFLTRSPDQQVEVLEPAVSEAQAELEPAAVGLLKIAGKRKLTPDEEEEALELASAWFYLTAQTGQDIRGLSFSIRNRKTLDFAQRLAGFLNGGQRASYEEFPAQVATAELELLFQGTYAHWMGLSLQPAGAATKASFVRDIVAPHAERALKEAEERLAERGMPRETLYGFILTGHLPVFGKLVDRSLFNRLRAAGVWTEYVAMLSIKAAEGLARILPSYEARELLSQAAAEYNLRLPIPAWHELAQAHETVADWLEFQYGSSPAGSTGISSIPLFKAFGIPVRAHPSFLFMFALVSWSLGAGFFPEKAPELEPFVHTVQGVAAAVLFFGSIVAHEFGHALVGRIFGIRTREIILHVFGGVAALDRELRRPMGEFLMAIAGPAVSAALALLCYAIAGLTGAAWLSPVFAYLAMINMMLLAFNMVPAFPMDGGRVLRAFLAWWLGDHYRATQLASRIGRGFGQFLIGLGGVLVLFGNLSGIYQIFLGFFLMQAAQQSGLHPGTELIEPKAARR